MYPTAAGLSYLIQTLLALTITGYLVTRCIRHRGQQLHTLLFTGFFGGLTLLFALLWLEATFLTTIRLYALLAQAVVLCLSLVLFQQFAYHFPTPALPRREARFILGLSSLYTLAETGYALYRTWLIGTQGHLVYRPDWADYAIVSGWLWALVVLLRQTRRAAPPAKGPARAFTLVATLPVLLSSLMLLRTFHLISEANYSLLLSTSLVGAMATLAVVYINALPEITSFMVKLTGLTLTALLMVLGCVGWIITPPFAASYRPPLPAQQTLRFTPNAAGGYDVEPVPYHFEMPLGRDLELSDNPKVTGRPASAWVDFDFTFYGQRYSQVYVTHDGALAWGREVSYRDHLYYYGHAPLIFALLVDLVPDAGGGVYVYPTADRLTVTWYRIPAYSWPDLTFTFQVQLSTTGVFEITYAEVPARMSYTPEQNPWASAWLIGTTPGGSQWPAHLDIRTLIPTGGAAPGLLRLQGGPQGAVQDYYLDFRTHLRTVLWPITLLIVTVSLMFNFGFPLLFYIALVRPLNLLMASVQRLTEQDYSAVTPVLYDDEIGFLARAFNTLAAQLGDLIHNLETRVAARTQDLADANARLRTEMAEHAAAEARIAALSEREQLSRDLHDGLGQTLGYIAVEAQAAQALLSQGAPDAAQANLAQLAQAAQEAHNAVRTHILGLRNRPPQEHDLETTLQAYLAQFSAASGIAVALSWPTEAPVPAFSPAVEEQVLHIIQEALTNVRKHAHAQRAEVVFSFTPQQAQVMISDDGRGFEFGQPGSRAATPPALQATSGSQPPGSHFGLTMMRERAVQIGGQLELRSAPGQGTRVLLTVPRDWPTTAPGPDTTSTIKGLRVLLVDDSRLFLSGLRNLLAARGVLVVGMAYDGLEAQVQARRLQPDVILMDVQMPRCDGLTALRAIKAELPATQIVMLTVAEDEETLFSALKSGAAGYLFKNLDANEFMALLAGLTRGEVPLAPGLATRLLQEFSRSEKPEAAGELLTARQWEILDLTAQGLTYKEIAARLYLSEATVKYHIGKIMERLQVETRAEAMAYARRRRSR